MPFVTSRIVTISIGHW